MKKDFENAFKTLTGLIEKMESGGLTLDESLQSFEKGIKLIRECQTQLKNAEQKILVYNKNSPTNHLDEFHES